MRFFAVQAPFFRLPAGNIPQGLMSQAGEILARPALPTVPAEARIFADDDRTRLLNPSSRPTPRLWAAPFVHSFEDSLSSSSLHLLERKARRWTGNRETRLLTDTEQEDAALPAEDRLRRFAQNLMGRESLLSGRVSAGGYLLGPKAGAHLWPSWDPNVLAETVWEILDTADGADAPLPYHALHLSLSLPRGTPDSRSSPEDVRRHESLRVGPKVNRPDAPYRTPAFSKEPLSIHNYTQVNFAGISWSQEAEDLEIHHLDYAAKTIVIAVRMHPQEPYTPASRKVAFLELTDREWAGIAQKGRWSGKETINLPRIGKIVERELSKRFLKREIVREIRRAWFEAMLRFIPHEPDWFRQLPDSVRDHVSKLAAEIDARPSDLTLLESAADRLAGLLGI